MGICLCLRLEPDGSKLVATTLASSKPKATRWFFGATAFSPSLRSTTAALSQILEQIDKRVLAPHHLFKIVNTTVLELPKDWPREPHLIHAKALKLSKNRLRSLQMESKQRISPITRIENEVVQAKADEIVVEAPLAIMLQTQDETTRNLAVTMRTPGEDRFLCAGFLLTEGIIDSVDDIETIDLTEQGDVGQAKIRLRAGCHPDPRRLERNIYTHSSCGVCSKPTLESIQVQAPSLRISRSQCSRPRLFTSCRSLYAVSKITSMNWRIHAAVDDHLGKVRNREDVGRHNARDKLIGQAMLNGQLPLHRHAATQRPRRLRADSEGTRSRCSDGDCAWGLTTMAVALAHQVGMTLVGFLKQDRFNIYTHPHRIVSDQDKNP